MLRFTIWPGRLVSAALVGPLPAAILGYTRTARTTILIADTTTDKRVLIAGYETQEYTIPVAGRTLRLLGPKWPHAVHNDPRRQAHYDQAGYRPYWTQPWPAAVMLAEHVIRHVPPGPQPILELGAGLGLVGLALTLAGHRVIVTDCDEEALEFVRASARLNAVELCGVRRLDWHQPPVKRYATIVGAEVVFTPETHAPLAALLAACLTPAGRAYVSDANRRVAETFPAALHAAGLNFRKFKARAPAIPGFDSVDGRVFDGTVYHVFISHDPAVESEPHILREEGFEADAV